VSETRTENVHLVKPSELIGVFCKKMWESKVAVNNHIENCNGAYNVLQICPHGENMCKSWSVSRICQIPICLNLHFVREQTVWSCKVKGRNFVAPLCEKRKVPSQKKKKNSVLCFDSSYGLWFKKQNK